MDHLRRELAPITDAAWVLIDEEARTSLGHYLAARALVDFSGPHGWDHSAESLGRVRPSTHSTPSTHSPVEGVVADIRTCLPLVELRTPFELSLSELDSADRGAPDPDLSALTEAARLAALAEDRALFDGYEDAEMAGIASGSPHDPLPIDDDYHKYPGVVASAVAELRRAGIGGPYAIALGSRCYTGVIETTEHGGYPVLNHVKLILGGPVVWAPAVDGAVVVSQRGGDYELVSGQDLSIGYRGHTEDEVHLYLEESLTLRVHEPKAAIALRYPG
ncbi:MAG: family 1 encapsulin nanocompartment shell protein [Acidimicrobiales bacterium]